MAFVGLDPVATRALAAALTGAGEQTDGIQRDVTAALALSQLESAVPITLDDVGLGLQRVGVVLTVRADVAEGFTVDPADLVVRLGLTLAESEAVAEALATSIADGTLAAGPDETTPLLDALFARGVAAEADLDEIAAALGVPRAVLNLQIQALALNGVIRRDHVLAALADVDDLRIDSTADLLDLAGAPLPADVVDRLDAFYLPAFLSGTPIDEGRLSDDQARDLRLLAGALGGGEVRVTFTETYYSSSDKEDRKRTRTEPIDNRRTPVGFAVDFVNRRLYEGLAVTATTRAIDHNLDRFASGEISIAATSEASGLSEAEVSRAVAIAAEARFRRTGEPLDLTAIPAFAGPGTVDVTTDGSVVLASASTETSTDPSAGLSGLTDAELANELSEIGAGIDTTAAARSEREGESFEFGVISGTIGFGASFLGPPGVAAAVVVGGIAVAEDYAARAQVEEYDEEIRELRAQQEQIRQEQLDRAIADADEEGFALDEETKNDIAALEGRIDALNNEIADLDDLRADDIDAGFLTTTAGEAAGSLLGVASARAKGLDAAVSFLTGNTFTFGSIGVAYVGPDAIDADRRREIEELLARRDALRREQLRETGDPAGVFTEQEAAVELADAEFELSQEIERAEQERERQAQAEAERRQREADVVDARRREQEFNDLNRDERSEPNGGQVDHADPGVGHGDLPDSF
ncbi:MAG: hypothetical protein AAF467_13065 [Actinomycetota bacterium]